jgi:hypothetical protein
MNVRARMCVHTWEHGGIVLCHVDVRLCAGRDFHLRGEQCGLERIECGLICNIHHGFAHVKMRRGICVLCRFGLVSTTYII